MKITKNMIQTLLKYGYQHNTPLFYLCLKLGGNPLISKMREYDYRKGKKLTKNIVQDIFNEASYYRTDIAHNFLKHCKKDVSKIPLVKSYIAKHKIKYSVNKKTYSMTKMDKLNFIDFYIDYAIDNDDSKLLKKIIKECNFSLNDNKNILEIMIDKRMNSKMIFDVYSFIREKIDSKNYSLIMLLIEKMFEEKTNHKGNKIHNYFKDIMNDQINNLGLNLAKFKIPNKNNLLHYYFHNNWRCVKFEIVNFLVNQDVSLTDFNKEGKTPFHSGLDFTGYSKDAGKIAELLINKKLDLTLEDAKGISILTNLLQSELQVQHYIPLMKTVELKDVGLSELKPIFNRNRKSENLVKEYISRGALSELKMLEYIMPKYNYKEYIPYYLVQQTTKLPEYMFNCLKRDKLKEFLSDIFGVTSSNMTNFFLEKTKSISDYDRNKVFDFLNAGYVLNHIFIKTEPKNPNYMMDLLKLDYVIEGIETCIKNTSVEQTMNFFVKNFSQQQSKILLESMNILNNDEDSWDNQSYLYDSVDMYWQYPEQLTAMFKELKFSNINTFKKLHDYLALETRKLEQAPYNLNQEEKTPELKEVHQKNIGIDKYSIYVAQHNYDLINWGSALHNCIGGGGYAEDARDGESLIMGIVYDDEIKYCVEISNDDKNNRRIVQMEGIGRCKIPAPVLKAFAKTLKKAKILKNIKEYTKEEELDE